MDASRCAGIILGLYHQFRDGFAYITRRSAERFARRQWHEFHADAVERLDLYRTVVDAGVVGLSRALGPSAADRALYPRVKASFERLVENEPDRELAETFFNSVTRRLFTPSGVDAAIQFVEGPPDLATGQETLSMMRVYCVTQGIVDVVRRVLQDSPLATDFTDLERDVAAVAARIEGEAGEIEAVEVLGPLFYRNKGCYIVGRLRGRGGVRPLVLPLLPDGHGVRVDAVLTESSEVSIVFSFTRSYFFCDAPHPGPIVDFLQTVMPRKPRNELYISLGFNKHGKTLLYRDLIWHLERSSDVFVEAPGQRGMVMLVLTLPSYPVVLKVIRDVFDAPKTTTREQVKRQYRLVFTHDRAGRLVDAQEFLGLVLPTHRFSPELLERLRRDASYSVTVGDDEVVFHHVYTERRLTPLDVYLQQVTEDAAREAVVEYGCAIKDLVWANIFPGDLLLKNFGVTPHGRVVFYDYDELCLITECCFRALPPPATLQDELWGEPWYSVAENDVFPEELRWFLGLSGSLREAYEDRHADLFEVEYWLDIQRRIRDGFVADIFPYRPERRLGFEKASGSGYGGGKRFAEHA